MKIGIDIDNVISDSYPAYLEKFNKNFGTNLTLEEMKQVNTFPQIKGVSQKVVDAFVDKLLSDFEFQLSLPPVNEAKKVISNWQRMNYHLHYITARPKHIKQATLKWLENHGFVKKREVLKMNAYFDSRNPPPKSDPEYKKEVVEEHGIELLIEDHPEVARIMDIDVFLIDKPWNQGKLPENVIRVKSWKEIRIPFFF